jgi:hypothetical protein
MYVCMYVFIFSLFNDGFPVTQDYLVSNERMICEWWIGRDAEGSNSGLIEDTIPAFTARDCKKQRKTSVMITGLQAEIWTQDFPTTKQEC